MKKAVELSPRNDEYLYNLGSLYMANRRIDEAIPLFESLTRSSEAGVAARATQALEQARQFKEYMSKGGDTRPVLTARNSSSKAEEVVEVAPPPVSTGPAHFLKGKILRTECGSVPGALLTVQSAGKELKFRISDRQHVVLIGADQFSCDWVNQAVAINFRDGKDGAGEVISLEVQ